VRRLLLIEDNETLSAGLKTRLQQSFEVVLGASVSAVKKIFLNPVRFDVAVVDIFLPDGSGIELAKKFLLPQKIPVLFLSAFSSAEYRLEALEAGGADFIPKPFHLRELVLRIDRVLSNSSSHPTGNSFIIQGVTIDFDSRTVSHGGTNSDRGGSGQSILSLRDAELLKILVTNAPRSISREELAASVWGEEGGAVARTIDNGVVRLRQALGPAASALRSVRGIGYQWVPGLTQVDT